MSNMGDPNATLHQTEKLINTSVKALEDIVAFILKKLDEHSEKKMADALIGHHKKGGGLSFVESSDVYTKDLLKAYKAAGIPACVIDNNEFDKQLIVIRDIDSKRANMIRDELLIRKSLIGVTNLKDMAEANKHVNIDYLEGMSTAEIEYMSKQAASNGYTIAPELDKETGTWRMYYQIRDAEKIHLNINKMAWDFTGKYGEQLIAQMEYDIKNKDKVKALTNKKDVDFYIVDPRNQHRTIHIDSESVRFIKDGNIISQADRSDPNFKRELDKMLGKFDNFVLLSEEEYKLSENQRDRLIKKRNKRPRVNYKEKSTRDKQEAVMKETIREKFNPMKGNQPKLYEKVYNGEMPYDEFFDISKLDPALPEEVKNEIVQHLNDYVKRVQEYEFGTYDYEKDKPLDSIIEDLGDSEEHNTPIDDRGHNERDDLM